MAKWRVESDAGMTVIEAKSANHAKRRVAEELSRQAIEQGLELTVGHFISNISYVGRATGDDLIWFFREGGRFEEAKNKNSRPSTD